MAKEASQPQKSILYEHHWQETGKSKQANDISQCSDSKVDDSVNPVSKDPKHQDSIESENRNANIFAAFKFSMYFRGVYLLCQL